MWHLAGTPPPPPPPPPSCLPPRNSPALLGGETYRRWQILSSRLGIGRRSRDVANHMTYDGHWPANPIARQITINGRRNTGRRAAMHTNISHVVLSPDTGEAGKVAISTGPRSLQIKPPATSDRCYWWHCCCCCCCCYFCCYFCCCPLLLLLLHFFPALGALNQARLGPIPSPYVGGQQRKDGQGMGWPQPPPLILKGSCCVFCAVVFCHPLMTTAGYLGGILVVIQPLLVLDSGTRAWRWSSSTFQLWSPTATNSISPTGVLLVDAEFYRCSFLLYFFGLRAKTDCIFMYRLDLRAILDFNFDGPSWLFAPLSFCIC